MGTQEKLFNIEPIRIKRPTIYTIDGHEAYKKIALDILEWEQNSGDDEEDVNSLIEELRDKFDLYELQDDGYEICKKLESKLMFSPDQELVEIMGQANWHIRASLKESIKKWVDDCWIKPKFKIGDKMEITYNRKKYQAEIKEVRESEAQYLFNIPEVMKETSGVCVDFEEVEPDFFKKTTE